MSKEKDERGNLLTGMPIPVTMVYEGISLTLVRFPVINYCIHRAGSDLPSGTQEAKKKTRVLLIPYLLSPKWTNMLALNAR